MSQELGKANFSHEMGQCHKVISTSIAENFEQAKSPEGVPWEPRKKSYSWPMLRRTMTLFNSVTKRAAKGAVWKTTKNTLTRGTKIAYAAFLHFGVKRKKVKYSRTSKKFGIRKFTKLLSIAARRFVGISDDAKEECQEIIRAKIRKMLRPR